MPTDTRSGRRAFLGAAGSAAAAVALGGWAPVDQEAPPKRGPVRGYPVTAVTLIHGLPGRDEELKAHLLSLAGPTRAEAGCITYDLYQSPDAKHEFMRFEMWTSMEALEAHKAVPHLRASFEKRQREGWTTQIILWNRIPG